MRVVMFSGGVGSWAAAKRLRDSGVVELTLLFTDTHMEDVSLYAFLTAAAQKLGHLNLIRIADGRTPWQVFEDVRMIGNTRMDPCSRILKRDLARKWVEENCDPATTTLYFGIDWTEANRMDAITKRWAPWKVNAPLLEPPYLSKCDMLDMVRAEGLPMPRLYTMGFPHNNCGGFCIKGGFAAFALLLEKMPERYAWHEAQEERLRGQLGDHSILRDRRGGKTVPLTMRAFRERVEAGEKFDRYDWGGCGCFVGEEAAMTPAHGRAGREGMK